MDISLIIAIVLGVLAGAVVALKAIAPRTKNTVDDKILDYAEKAEDFVETVAPKAAK